MKNFVTALESITSRFFIGCHAIAALFIAIAAVGGHIAIRPYNMASFSTSGNDFWVGRTEYARHRGDVGVR